MLNLRSSTQQLCMDLLRADTEEQVINLLREQGYWDAPDAWRPFGDKPDNFSTMGNQSSSPDAALVEKLVNSVDAVLMGECLTAGISPNSEEAPQSIPEAVAQFFFGDRSKANSLGHISRWPNQKRRELSDRITLAATGARSNPSFTVVDAGEGQTPESMPDTLLSLDKQNKVDVHFVQGKFNMGGTGALRFCGASNLQLVISRRNPNIKMADEESLASSQWGFTIVRRENPTASKRLSTYTYLAPEPNRGVLRFDSETLPLFPEGKNPYVRNTPWGTAIKLYEYKLAEKSHILLPDGLLYRLDLLLPGVALPIRLHECRAYRGHEGSFDTTLTGLEVRLSDGRGENVEQGFPTSSPFAIRGQEMTAEVYAFKRGRAATYRNDEGVVFTVNGQTHGNLPKRFFSRNDVGMNSLEDSILVIVDCSRIDGRTREDLFMNSRDRMEQGEFLRDIRTELALILKNNQSLRDLTERRRREDVEKKLTDSKPLVDVIESIIRKSPSVAHLLGRIGPLSDPFKSVKNKSSENFHGKPHPSFFRFKDKDYGEELHRKTARNMRSRIAFETDVVSDYFSRAQYAGRYTLRSLDGSLLNGNVPAYNLNLDDGIATLNLALPNDAKVGDSFRYDLIVQDETLIEPFVNRLVISVGPGQEISGGKGDRNKRGGESGGDDPTKKTDQGLSVPIPTLVYEPDWSRHNFDKYSALKVEYYPSTDEKGVDSHEYFLNMDNIHLKTELKGANEDMKIVKSRWQFGMILVGIALLNQANQKPESEDAPPPEENVREITTAIAPILLPMIEHLGALSETDS